MMAPGAMEHDLRPQPASSGHPPQPALAAVAPLHTAIPGRARFRIVGLAGTPAAKQAIERDLGQHAGIRAVDASLLTGNVLVIYEVSQPLEDIIRILSAASAPWADLASAPAPAAQAAAAPARRPVPAAPEQSASTWHDKDAQAAIKHFGSAKTRGLTRPAAAARLEKYGANQLPEAPKPSNTAMFLRQFASLPVALLGVSAALSLLTGGLAEAVVIAAVVASNAAIGYATEKETEKTLNALGKEVETVAQVIRDGQLQQIPSWALVPGDLLALRQGQQVGADARLIEARNLTVDEASLTGESLPVLKSPARLATLDTPLAERSNMVYMGTLVTGGSGLAVVVATGAQTEIGLISHLVSSTETPKTPIQKQLDQMGTQLVLLSAAACGLVGIIGLARGYGLLQMLKATISLGVAAVPEGLPTVATTTLVLGIRRMRRHKVLVRRLSAVETLGALQVICLDKTGTLTLNRMSVLALYTGGRHIFYEEGLLCRGSRPVNPYTHDELLRLLHVGVLCSESTVEQRQGNEVINGSPTENALIELAVGCGVNVHQLRARYPLCKMTYRAEQRPWMASIHTMDDQRWLVAIKGSPEAILARCRWLIRDGQKIELDDALRAQLLHENERMAQDALRVLAMAYTETTGDMPDADDPRDLSWLGLVGMADPIRHGVKSFIELFHQAGIQTVMITGDQSATACAIGRTLNLGGNGDMHSMDAQALERMGSAALGDAVKDINIFARVSPADKLKIVQALQQTGQVIAMTGDGINDSPALKAADVGIAMGDTGTPVAHRVADVVLEEGNLQTLIVAVSQGRTIYNNIRKALHFLLATNLSEIEVMLGSMALGMGQPLNAMQLLWINLLTDVFPAIALSAEPAEPDILQRPPRDPAAPIIQRSDFRRYARESLLMTGSTLFAYGYGRMRYGAGGQASTLAFHTLVSAQLLHAVVCRSDTHGVFSRAHLPANRYLQAAIGGSFALQALAGLFPPLRSLLGITPLGVIDFAVVGAGAVVPFVLNEMAKPDGKPAAAWPERPRSDSRLPAAPLHALGQLKAER